MNTKSRKTTSKRVEMIESTRIEEARIRAVYAKREDGDRYSLFQPGTLFIAQQIERRILWSLTRYGFADLSSKKILEVGCGSGHWLRELTTWGARPEHVYGVDLLRDRLSKARSSCSPAIRLQCGSAAELPFPDASFDLVLQSTVFTSILDPDLKCRAAQEMMRVLTHDGIILWYDYHVNNPWNPDVRGVKRSEITRLFPGCRIELQRMTLFPPLARWLAPYSFLACYVLEKIPPLCTQYLGVIRKA
jgi:ubiquinone/menaquinone biosynthesis C-methylase UbiE